MYHELKNATRGFTGQGKATFSNRDEYEGDFVDGERDGKGVYCYVNGDRYEGEWTKNFRHG